MGPMNAADVGFLEHGNTVLHQDYRSPVGCTSAGALASHSSARSSPQERAAHGGPTTHPTWPPRSVNARCTESEARSRACARISRGSNGSSRALISRVGTRMRDRYGSDEERA